jgi:hypothetical protein
MAGARYASAAKAGSTAAGRRHSLYRTTVRAVPSSGASSDEGPRPRWWFGIQIQVIDSTFGRHLKNTTAIWISINSVRCCLANICARQPQGRLYQRQRLARARSHPAPRLPPTCGIAIASGDRTSRSHPAAAPPTYSVYGDIFSASSTPRTSSFPPRSSPNAAQSGEHTAHARLHLLNRIHVLNQPDGPRSASCGNNTRHITKSRHWVHRSQLGRGRTAADHTAEDTKQARRRRARAPQCKPARRKPEHPPTSSEPHRQAAISHLAAASAHISNPNPNPLRRIPYYRGRGRRRLFPIPLVARLIWMSSGHWLHLGPRDSSLILVSHVRHVGVLATEREPCIVCCV